MVQPIDLFFSEKIQHRHSQSLWTSRWAITVDLSGCLNGASVFLIAGGPSFSQVDPSFLSRPGIASMALNNAVKSFRPNWWITVDDPANFLHSAWLDPTITKLVRSENRGKRIFNSTTWCESSIPVEQCPNVYLFDSNLEFNAEQFLRQDSVNWGGDSSEGGRSVFLAALKHLYHLGAGNVFLLGVDFEMKSDVPYHFQEHKAPEAVRANNRSYQILSERLNSLRPHFEADDFFVWNCNPNSKLQAFPFCSIQEAIAIATARMPLSLEDEPTKGMYGRVVGENDSAETIGKHKPISKEKSPRRIDRSKLPQCVTASALDPIQRPPDESAGLVILVDREQEWILPWWHHHFERTNSDLPVTLFDLGVTQECRNWCEHREFDVRSLASPFPSPVTSWFLKPQAIASSPYDLTIFCDLDCELRSAISPMFSWANAGVVLGKDLFPIDRYRKMFREKFYYNSGLIGVNRANPIIPEWCRETESLLNTFRSDQEILNLTLYQTEAKVVELPDHFHQLRLAGEHEDAVVMHWTGPQGKNHVRNQMEKLRIETFR